MYAHSKITFYIQIMFYTIRTPTINKLFNTISFCASNGKSIYLKRLKTGYKTINHRHGLIDSKCQMLSVRFVNARRFDSPNSFSRNRHSSAAVQLIENIYISRQHQQFTKQTTRFFHRTKLRPPAMFSLSFAAAAQASFHLPRESDGLTTTLPPCPPLPRIFRFVWRFNIPNTCIQSTLYVLFTCADTSALKGPVLPNYFITL